MTGDVFFGFTILFLIGSIVVTLLYLINEIKKEDFYIAIGTVGGLFLISSIIACVYWAGDKLTNLELFYLIGFLLFLSVFTFTFLFRYSSTNKLEDETIFISVCAISGVLTLLFLILLTVSVSRGGEKKPEKKEYKELSDFLKKNPTNCQRIQELSSLYGQGSILDTRPFIGYITSRLQTLLFIGLSSDFIKNGIEEISGEIEEGKKFLDVLVNNNVNYLQLYEHFSNKDVEFLDENPNIVVFLGDVSLVEDTLNYYDKKNETNYFTENFKRNNDGVYVLKLNEEQINEITSYYRNLFLNSKVLEALSGPSDTILNYIRKLNEPVNIKAFEDYLLSCNVSEDKKNNVNDDELISLLLSMTLDAEKVKLEEYFAKI